MTHLAPPPPPGLRPGPVPGFSVVIPAYQAADVVGQAVASALAQTVAPVEVIVCDDGSTDDITGALAPYRDQIVLVRKDNGGGASALNAAIAAAGCEFVSWLDADDAYEPERLQALGELAAERPDLDILMTDSYLEAGGRVVGRFTELTPFAERDQPTAILDRCFVAWPAIRRSRVLSVGGFDEQLRIAYDWDFWIRSLHAGARAGLVTTPLHRYRISQGSLSGARPAAIRERVTVLEKAAANPDVGEDERPALAVSLRSKRRRALLTEAEWAIRDGEPDARRRALAVAVARGPRFGARTRLKAGIAALLPAAAARRLARREQEATGSRLTRWAPD